jgi:hypothetical protein
MDDTMKYSEMPNSSDLIYRQAAIDAMNGLPKWIDTDYGVCLDYSDVMSVLGDAEKLPSAQPEQIARDIATIIENEQDMRVLLKNTERTETHSCDCERTETHDLISRQAAIDAVNGMPDCPNGFSGTYDKAAIIGILEDVPSVQPQLSEEDATIWLNGFISGAYIRGME